MRHNCQIFCAVSTATPRRPLVQEHFLLAFLSITLLYASFAIPLERMASWESQKVCFLCLNQTSVLCCFPSVNPINIDLPPVKICGEEEVFKNNIFLDFYCLLHILTCKLCFGTCATYTYIFFALNSECIPRQHLLLQQCNNLTIAFLIFYKNKFYLYLFVLLQVSLRRRRRIVHNIKLWG